MNYNKRYILELDKADIKNIIAEWIGMTSSFDDFPAVEAEDVIILHTADGVSATISK